MSDVAVITQPNTSELEMSLVPLVKDCMEAVISTKDDHQGGLEMIRTIVQKERAVKDLFAQPKALSNAAHKAITAAEKKLLVPLDQAKRALSSKCTSYEFEQKRLADEERRRQEEQARKAQEDSQLLDAAVAEGAGETETAEAILQAPIAVPVVDVQPDIGKVEGVGTTTRWNAEVVDKMALIRYVAANPEWEGLLDANKPNLRRLAISQRENMKIPGVKARPEYTKTVRTGG